VLDLRKTNLHGGIIIAIYFIDNRDWAPSSIADYEDAINHNMKNRLQSPSKEHIFGTDHYGRDIFARIIYGARVSLLRTYKYYNIFSYWRNNWVSSGYFGGVLDNIIMRIMDVLMALPSMLLAISIVAALGPGLTNLLIAISVSYIAQFARIIRSSVLSIKNQEFIEAAVACGTKGQQDNIQTCYT